MSRQQIVSQPRKLSLRRGMPGSFFLTLNAHLLRGDRFDAVGLVTATNVWVDGCEFQDQLSGEYVQPDIIDPGWQVDRFDGKPFDPSLSVTDNTPRSLRLRRRHRQRDLFAQHHSQPSQIPPPWWGDQRGPTRPRKDAFYDIW